MSMSDEGLRAEAQMCKLQILESLYVANENFIIFVTLQFKETRSKNEWKM